MKITMLTRIEGTRNGSRWPEAGTVIDLPDGEAGDLISTGIAVAAKAAAPKIEKATAPKSEKRG